MSGILAAAPRGPPDITADTGGLDVIAPAFFSTLDSYTDTSGSWQKQYVTRGFFIEGIAWSATAVTTNDGSENIAAFGLGGDLDFFYWDGENFQEEIVAHTVN